MTELLFDLSDVPFAEALAEAARRPVAGMATLLRDGRSRRFYLDGGRALAATTNDSEWGFARFLIRHGVLTPAILRKAEPYLASGRVRLGQVLVEMDVLTPGRRDVLVTDHMRGLLLEPFDWAAGVLSWETGVAPPEGLFRVDWPMEEAVAEGLRRASDVKRMAQRLGNAQTLLEPTGRAFPEALLPAAHAAYYRQLDGRTPLQALSTRGPGGVGENTRILYGFLCLGLARTKSESGVRKLKWRTAGGRIGA